MKRKPKQSEFSWGREDFKLIQEETKDAAKERTEAEKRERDKSEALLANRSLDLAQVCPDLQGTRTR